MKYAWAVPGAKVVCIKRDPWEDLNDGEVGPKYGDVLTIRDVFSEDDIYMTFLEIVNSPMEYIEGFSECMFLAEWFRPLRTVEDDVALFAHHLTPAPTDLTVA